MSITINCNCGKQTRIADEYAGRRIKCPACKKPIDVPEEEEASKPKRSESLTTKPKAREEADTFRFKCEECGKRVEAREDQVGKMVKCTACGLRQEVPDLAQEDEEDAGSGRIRADRPEPRRNGVASRKRDDDDDDERPRRRGRDDEDEYDYDDEEDDDEGGSRGKKKKKSKLPLILILTGLVLLLGGGAFGVYWFRFRATEDFAKFVPGDGQGFIWVRVADVWKVDATKKADAKIREVDPKIGDLTKEIKEDLGIGPEDIEWVGMVISDYKSEKQNYAVIKTIKPYDQEKIKNTLKDPKTVTYEGKKLLVGTKKDGKKEAYCFVSKRVLLNGLEEGVKVALDVVKKKSKGPLDEPLKLTKGKDHLVAGFSLPSKDMSQLKQVMGFFGLAALSALADAQSGAIVAKWGDSLDLDITVKFADEAKAKLGKEAADKAVVVAKDLLNKKAGQKSNSGIKSLQSALDGVKVEQKGASVTLTGRAEVIGAIDGVVALLGGGPGGGEQGGGPGVANKQRSINNLKQISLAMHNHHDQMRHLPVDIKGPQGQPLLSWRVAILPYIEHDALYRQFRLNEPWNSPHNIKLVSKMPKTYALPGDAGSAAGGLTPYAVFNGAKALFGANPKPTIQGITDGSTNTIMVVESSRMATWSKPDDIAYAPNMNVKRSLRQTSGGGFNVAMASGEARTLKPTISEKTLHAAITPNGAEILGPDW
jgi:hypothetical protein